jgi:hypothetical protein
MSLVISRDTLVAYLCASVFCEHRVGLRHVTSSYNSAMKWLRLALEVVGGLALVMLAVVGASVVWQFRQSDRINAATKRDARFILNWAGIPTDEDYKVVASYQSSRSFTGDHFDAFCIDLPKFEETKKTNLREGPETNPLLAEALAFGLNSAHDRVSCIPSPEAANSKAMRIMFSSVLLHDRYPTAADIIVYDPAQKKLYYVSYKT